MLADIISLKNTCVHDVRKNVVLLHAAHGKILIEENSLNNSIRGTL